eukprot:scaffold173094_cov43-Prasinocladus_malaysianus.AAC.1
MGRESRARGVPFGRICYMLAVARTSTSSRDHTDAFNHQRAHANLVLVLVAISNKPASSASRVEPPPRLRAAHMGSD